MNVPRDKVLHLAAGAALALIGLLADGQATAAALCLLGGLARELYALPGGRFSWSDLLATAIGGGAVLALHGAWPA